MSKFVRSLMTFPARWTGAVGTVAGAVYVLGGQFTWWHWTPDQTAAVTGLTTAVLGLVSAFGVHALVTPNIRLDNPPPPPPGDSPPDAPYAPQIDGDALAAAIPPPAAPGAGEGEIAAQNPPAAPPGA